MKTELPARMKKLVEQHRTVFGMGLLLYSLIGVATQPFINHLYQTETTESLVTNAVYLVTWALGCLALNKELNRSVSGTNHHSEAPKSS